MYKLEVIQNTKKLLVIKDGQYIIIECKKTGLKRKFMFYKVNEAKREFLNFLNERA